MNAITWIVPLKTRAYMAGWSDCGGDRTGGKGTIAFSTQYLFYPQKMKNVVVS